MRLSRGEAPSNSSTSPAEPIIEGTLFISSHSHNILIKMQGIFRKFVFLAVAAGFVTGCGKGPKSPESGAMQKNSSQASIARYQQPTSSWKQLTTLPASPVKLNSVGEPPSIDKSTIAKQLGFLPSDGVGGLNPPTGNSISEGQSITLKNNTAANFPPSPGGDTSPPIPISHYALKSSAFNPATAGLSPTSDNIPFQGQPLSAPSLNLPNNSTNFIANRSSAPTNFNANFSATNLSPGATNLMPISRLNPLPSSGNPTSDNPILDNSTTGNPSLKNPLRINPTPLTPGGTVAVPQILPAFNPNNSNPNPPRVGGNKNPPAGDSGNPSTSGGSASEGGGGDSDDSGTKIAGLPNQPTGGPGPGDAEVGNPNVPTLPPGPSDLRSVAGGGISTAPNSGLYLSAGLLGTVNPGMGVGSGDGHVQTGAFARLNVISPDGKQGSTRITPNRDYCAQGQTEVPEVFPRDNRPQVKLETGLPPNESWVEIPGDPSFPRLTDFCGELLVALKPMLNPETHCVRSMRFTVTYTVGAEKYTGQATLSCADLGASASAPFQGLTSPFQVTVQLSTSSLQYLTQPAASLILDETAVIPAD